MAALFKDLPTAYSVGTATVAANGTVVTGTGTAWLDILRVGDLFGTHKGYTVRIASIESETSLTLAYGWPGAAQTNAVYEIQLTPRSVGVQEATRQLLTLLANGNLSEIAELDGAANNLFMFDGPGSLTLISKQDLTNGVAYNKMVSTLADRAAYNGSPADFAVLVANIGDGRAALYVKNSATSGDWSAPSYITGPVGPDGVQPRGDYAPGAAYVTDDLVQSGGSTWIALQNTTGNAPPTLPTTSNAYWKLFARAGNTWGNPRGDYAAGTAYNTLDSVQSGGSTWIALQNTTGNAPPTLPTTSNAYWQLVAAKGTDGTGIGDVVGPAGGVVVGDYAVFTSTTGKEIGKSLVPPGGQNDAILALEIADLKGSRLGMKGGVADAFDDETGVDIKTNAVYDATNDWYTPLSTPNIGDATNAPVPASTGGAATYTIFNYGLPLTNGKTIYFFSFNQSVAGSYTIKIAQRTAAGSYNIVYSQIVAHAGGGSQIFSLTAPFVIPATGSYVLGAYTAISTSVALIATTAGRAFKVGDLTGPQTGFTEDATQAYSIGAIYSSTVSNMTLRSINYAAASQPMTGRLAVQTVETDTILANTDLFARMTRDGGTTWAAATLSLSQSLIGPKIYEATGISLTALGAGTSMKWEIATANGKNVAVSGVVAQWS